MQCSTLDQSHRRDGAQLRLGAFGISDGIDADLENIAYLRFSGICDDRSV